MSYCSWDQSSELNIKYHDTEWGVPLHDDRGQFEFLMMEVMQCGLNWTMMINKREIFRSCFDNFEYDKIAEYFGINPATMTKAQAVEIVRQWMDAVVGLDRMVYEDARKEFSLAAMTGFGADGEREDKEHDFQHVRGDFDSNPFVQETLAHIERKTRLGEELIGRLD